MKQYNYKLSISNPCNQDWNMMTEKQSGKFCTICLKTVIDFSSMIDTEIIKVLNNSNEKVCGRLSPDQLDRVLMNQKQTNNFSTIHKFFASLLLLGVSGNDIVSGQTNHSEIKFNVQNKDTSRLISSSKEYPQNDSIKNEFIGRLFDAATKEPIMFATVIIKNTKIGTITDKEGKFKILLNTKQKLKKVNLMIYSVGYVASEIKIVNVDFGSTKDFYIKRSTSVLGEIAIIKIPKNKNCP